MARKNKRLNGDGSFTWVEDKKRWQYRITVAGMYDAKGKAVRKAFYGKTQNEARKKATEYLNRLETGTPFSKEEITIEQMAIRICQEKLADGTTQEHVFSRNLEAVARLGPIGQISISKVNTSSLKEFLISLRHYSDSVIKKEYNLLGQVFKAAVGEGIIIKNPMHNVKLPKSGKRREKVRALTKDEQRKFIHILLTEDVKYSEVMLVAVSTGMRVGEVLALNVRDVNFRDGTIHICKTMARHQSGTPFVNSQAKTEAGERTIRVGKDVILFLKKYIGDKSPDEMIFTNDGKLISTNTVNEHFQNAVKKYGFITPIEGKRVTLHSLRHTFATRCIESGMPPKVLQHCLGHKDIRTTYNIYGDVFLEFESEALDQANEYFESEGLTFLQELYFGDEVPIQKEDLDEMVKDNQSLLGESELDKEQMDFLTRKGTDPSHLS